MTERAGRVLKGISGVLLAAFGLISLAAPDLLASR
jgi:hypothetical protein